jgi:hypothetical protein
MEEAKTTNLNEYTTTRAATKDSYQKIKHERLVPKLESGRGVWRPDGKEYETERIHYDNGRNEWCIQLKGLRLKREGSWLTPDKAASRWWHSADEGKGLGVGEEVDALRQGTKKLQPGVIAAVHDDNTYEVKFDGGTTERLPRKRVIGLFYRDSKYEVTLIRVPVALQGQVAHQPAACVARQTGKEGKTALTKVVGCCQQCERPLFNLEMKAASSTGDVQSDGKGNGGTLVAQSNASCPDCLKAEEQVKRQYPSLDSREGRHISLSVTVKLSSLYGIEKDGQSEIKRISTDAGVSCAAVSPALLPAWAKKGEHWYELSVDPGIVPPHTDKQKYTLDRLHSLCNVPSPLPEGQSKPEHKRLLLPKGQMAKERIISVRMFERGFLRNAMERFGLVLRLEEICQQYVERQDRLQQWQREFQAGGLELFRSTARNTFGTWARRAVAAGHGLIQFLTRILPYVCTVQASSSRRIRTCYVPARPRASTSK